MTKKCTCCLKNKSIDRFGKNSGMKSGYLNKCKKCVDIKRKKYKSENVELFKERGLRYRKLNKEKIKESDKAYSLTEKGKRIHRKARLKWIKNNPGKNIESKKKWNRDNKKHRADYFQKTKKRQVQMNITRRRKNPQLKLRHNVSSLIGQRLKKRISSKKGKSTFDFLPYTVENLMSHLENQFDSRMSWDNYGKWHIDHIRPDCSFNYTSVEDEEFQKCWALDNLQPLWAKDNLRKNRYF